MTHSRDFAAFYAATFHPLCAQLYVHTGDLAEAQDVVQEAFCRALPRWSRLSQFDDPAAWVRKVAWNLATSRWRRLRRLTDLGQRPVEAATPAPSPDRVALQAALARLPPRQRQAIILHYLADTSVTDIAAMTGAADGTVKSWLHRGRAALAGHLGDERDPRPGRPSPGRWLPMADLDESLRAGLTDLRDAALPLIVAPGEAAARRTIRRRAIARASTVSTAAAVAVLLVLFGVPTLFPSPPPVLTPTPTGTPTSGPTPTGTPTSAPPSTDPPSPDPGDPGTAAGTGGTGVQLRICASGVLATVGPPSFTWTAELPNSTCATDGGSRVVWALYSLDPDGVARLVNSQEAVSRASNPSITFTLSPVPCGSVWFTFRGNDPIVASFPAPLPNPDAETIGAPFPYAQLLPYVRDVTAACPTPPASSSP